VKQGNANRGASPLRIDRVRAHDLELPYPKPFRPAWQPGLAIRSRSFTFVAVDAGGLTGYAGTDGHHAAVIHRDVTPYLVGNDVAAIERHARVLRNAGGAWFLELALWDLIGKALDQPLYRIWGFKRDAVRAYASTCELGTPDERAELAMHYRQRGYRAMKLRLHSPSLAEDLALLDAVRSAVPGMELMVDANQATDLPSPEPGPRWDYARALTTARQLEQRDVRWLEEPLARYDLDNLARLREATTIDIAGGEYNRGLHEFRWLIERGAYDIIQADGTVAEGVSQIRKVAAMAELFGRRFVPHHGLCGLGLAAMLHLACCVPGETWLEVMYEPSTRTFEHYQQLGGILTTRIEADPDGLVRPSAAAGLGIEVDEQAVGDYEVAA
jgi:D-galactarolactone cycloisomerase